jgi:two-component system sensor histidine kinase KdpD
VSEQAPASTDAAKPQIFESSSAGQHLLALLARDCHSESIVRSAQKLAKALNSPWIVLYVERRDGAFQENQFAIAKTLAFARELGAEVITTADEDVVAAVRRVAAQRNVTQIVLGKIETATRQKSQWLDSIVPRLLRESRSIGVHVIPAVDAPHKEPISEVTRMLRSPVQYFGAAAVIGAITLAAFLFTPIVGAHATALVFLLTVVLLALFVERGPTLMAATMSAVIWDYFFLPPVYAFRITNFEDAMFFAMYFVVALVLGNLTTRIRSQEAAERERQTRATLLYLLTRDLNESIGLDQMVQRIVEQLGSSFGARVAVLLPAAEDTFKIHPGGTLQIGESEKSLPAWVLKNRQRAGKFTNNSPGANALYIPLVTNSGAVGVLGLQFDHRFNLSLHQESLIEAISQQIAMALDRHRLNGISEKAKLLAESERLSKTLLDSMSHEIRTPLAAINSATGNLAELRDTDARIRQQMIAELQEATERLNRLVGNVLEASRLDSGTVKPRFNECDVRELINVALTETEKQLSGHEVRITIQPGLPVISLDFVLTQQALINLLTNCALHTPKGTLIEIEARLEDESLVLCIADRGPGIPSGSISHVFEKFYRVPNSRTGGTGLGLSLVKGFVEAQGGRVAVEKRLGGGVVFVLRLPRSNPAKVPMEM